MKLVLIGVIAMLVGCAPLTPEEQDRWAQAAQTMQAMQAMQPHTQPAPYSYTLPTTQYSPPSPIQYQPVAQFQPYQSPGVTATFTGSQQYVTTVTGMAGVSCQYQYAGRYFTRIFQGSCPSSVQVQ